MASDRMSKRIPVIDLFAGPGGLGEGFASLRLTKRRLPCFTIALSVEKEECAHRTLELRTLFRHLQGSTASEEYYRYVRGEITRDELFNACPDEAETARAQAWHAELGGAETPAAEVDKRIEAALEGKRWWVLVGGPPCQAYSIIGRSRMSKVRKKTPQKYDDDPRHLLYREYLRILAEHAPPVFVMENVPGLLSSRLKGASIFHRMIRDLQNPKKAVREAAENAYSGARHRYSIHSLVSNEATGSLSPELKPRDFVIRSEEYGIPQTRHRVILLGVRKDIEQTPRALKKHPRVMSVWDAISDTPRIRSVLSREKDSLDTWRESLQSVTRADWLDDPAVSGKVKGRIVSALSDIGAGLTKGGNFVPLDGRDGDAGKTRCDRRLKGYCNHSARRHMRTDLVRYLFAACFAEVEGRTPKLADYPEALLPLHASVPDALSGGYFNDRFRVQVKNEPSTTVVSHISKDGHYYIHPDPTQCRSLTVREAARLQTFPDNYFFEGPRTAQYRQVGNAVPPLLAKQIARIVYDLLKDTGGIN